jgi:hypothetical protein
MKRFSLTLAAVAIALVVVQAASASPHSGPSSSRGSQGSSGHYQSSSVVHHSSRPISGRFLSRGYRGWSRQYWNASYGCNFYYCGDDCSWYYWYPTWGCYCPVSYITTYPPTGTVTPGSLAFPPTNGPVLGNGQPDVVPSLPGMPQAN